MQRVHAIAGRREWSRSATQVCSLSQYGYGRTSEDMVMMVLPIRIDGSKAMFFFHNDPTKCVAIRLQRQERVCGRNHARAATHNTRPNGHSHDQRAHRKKAAQVGARHDRSPDH